MSSYNQKDKNKNKKTLNFLKSAGLALEESGEHYEADSLPLDTEQQTACGDKA